MILTEFEMLMAVVEKSMRKARFDIPLTITDLYFLLRIVKQAHNEMNQVEEREIEELRRRIKEYVDAK